MDWWRYPHKKRRERMMQFSLRFCVWIPSSIYKILQWSLKYFTEKRKWMISQYKKNVLAFTEKIYFQWIRSHIFCSRDSVPLIEPGEKKTEYVIKYFKRKFGNKNNSTYKYKASVSSLGTFFIWSFLNLKRHAVAITVISASKTSTTKHTAFHATSC